MTATQAETIAAVQTRADSFDRAALERAIADRWTTTGAGTAWAVTPRRAKDGLVRFAAFMLAMYGQALVRTEKDGTRHLITLDDYQAHREQS